MIMSEVNNNEIKFDINNRQFLIRKSDFKESKKEIFLFDYLTNNATNKILKSENKRVSLEKLDKENGTEGVITKQDIQIFLQDKKVQKNNITPEDVVNFLGKMIKANPTKEEEAISNLVEKYKDENGQTVMTPELKELFGLEYKSIKHSDFYDKDKNVKKGMEVFDLNGDGKIDKVEEKFLNKNVGYARLSDLENNLKELDKADTSDGKITKQDKMAMYNKIAQEETKLAHEKLENMDITDETGNKVISEEIKELFANGSDSVSFDEIVEDAKTGKLKSGMEIFDLNGDGKLDELERAYFTNNGHYSKTSKEKLELTSFLDAVTNLDKVGYVQSQGRSASNNEIFAKDKVGLYKMLSAGQYMLDNIKTFPQELQDKYIEVLSNKTLAEHDTKKSSVGINRADCIEVDTNTLSEPEIASVMVHEFAHTILSEKMSPLLQEVVTFYSEYRLYSEAVKNDPDYKQKVNGIGFSAKTSAVDTNYMEFVDKLRKEKPDMSEKDLAIEAFLKFQFESYNGRYQAKVSEDDIRNANYDAAKEFFE